MSTQTEDEEQTGKEVSDDRQVVVHPDSMDLDAFNKHMTYRHGDSLGGMPELKIRQEGQVSQAYRTFHRTLHRLRDEDLNHVHDDYHAESRKTA